MVRRAGQATRRLTGGGCLETIMRLIDESGLFSVGYISYEAALEFVAPELQPRQAQIPEMRFFLYDSVLKMDHETGRITATNPRADDYADALTEVAATEGAEKPPSEQSVRMMPREHYIEAVRQIKHHIHEGDIYQANFTNRIEVESSENPFAVYRRLRQLNSAPYSAYLNFGDYQILSSSPERMFLRTGDTITTGPIKGTIARGANLEEDTENRRLLLSSEKDRAELLMIVDLARNDLGRVAKVGSVRVDELFRPELYSSVIHLVSDITAEIRDDVSTFDMIRALLPGGSITGAPKKRACEIINKLELTPRSVYTGSMGYIHGDRADFNIAIRTMVHRSGCYNVHAGGGIVADSDPGAEYAEMMLKARNMLVALGVPEEKIAWRR